MKLICSFKDECPCGIDCIHKEVHEESQPKCLSIPCGIVKMVYPEKDICCIEVVENNFSNEIGRILDI